MKLSLTAICAKKYYGTTHARRLGEVDDRIVVFEHVHLGYPFQRLWRVLFDCREDLLVFLLAGLDDLLFPAGGAWLFFYDGRTLAARTGHRAELLLQHRLRLLLLRLRQWRFL